MSNSAQDLSQKEVLKHINFLLSNDEEAYVRVLLAELHEADIADMIERLEPENRGKILTLLHAQTASEVLTELDEGVREDVLESLDSAKIAELVNEMDSDDATDIVSELSEERVSEVLEQVEDEYSDDIQELLGYHEESAGGIMAKEYIAVNQDWTVERAIQEIRDMSEEVEDLYQCYVINNEGMLEGLVTLKALILADGKHLIADIMDDGIFPIKSDQDQEEVARIFERYDLVSAPVVDPEGRLIGRITIDDIVDVIQEEAEEDLGIFGGTGEEEILEDSIFQIARNRLPYLLIAFFGEVLSGLIMEAYKLSLEMIVASAFFIPLVMAMGGSTGQQSSIIVVRGLATGEIDPRDIFSRISRETRTALITGLVIALLIFLVVFVWQSNFPFAVLLSSTLMIVILNASLFGAVIPFGLQRLNIDPALATGPFVATFNDVIGLLIYFTLLTASLPLVTGG